MGMKTVLVSFPLQQLATNSAVFNVKLNKIFSQYQHQYHVTSSQVTWYSTLHANRFMPCILIRFSKLSKHIDRFFPRTTHWWKSYGFRK